MWRACRPGSPCQTTSERADVTPEEFGAWTQRRGLSDHAAGLLLRATRTEVWKWRTGKRQKIPARVQRIIEQMQHIESLNALLDVLSVRSPTA